MNTLSAPVKLDTFNGYTPISSSTTDLERGAQHTDTEPDSEGLEEELTWQNPSSKDNESSSSLIKQLSLFLAGVVVGASMLSLGSYLFTSTPREKNHSTFTSGSHKPNSLSPETLSFDFTSHPPVRIHYLDLPIKNSHSPLLPPSQCPIPVVYSSDPESADIVIFNSDSHQGIGSQELLEWKEKRPWQRTAITGVESAPNREKLEQHFDKLRQGSRNETYDYEMTYRLNSTVPTTYSYSYFNYSNPPVPYSQKRQDKIAASFISNCHPKNARTLVLDELTRLLQGKVDNYGSCHNDANADEELRKMGHYEEVGKNHNAWNTKITMINYYLFSIAFENSNDYDYVTEKYYQALERGSVPLVFGAPSYSSRFFPSPNAGIDIASYLPSNYTAPSRSDSKAPEELSEEAKAGLRRLAERLEFLSSEEGREEYEEMLEWKKDGKWIEDPDNPLGKIMRLSTSQWDQDCRLAGVYRGEDWAKSNYLDSDPS